MSGNKFFNFEKNNQSDDNRFVSPAAQQNQTFVAGSMPNNNFNNQNMMNNNMNNSGYDPMKQMPRNNNMMPDQGNIINTSFMSNQPMNNNMQRPMNQPMMQQPMNNNMQMQNNMPKNNMQPVQGNMQPVPPVNVPIQQPTIKPNLNGIQNPVQNNPAPVNNQQNNNQVAINTTKDKAEAVKANNGPDPLDNGKNPIPVNPVAEGPKDVDLEKLDRYMVSPKECLGVIKNMLFKPGTTIIDCANKYRSLKSGLLFTLYFMIITAVLCLIGGAISSIFVKTYSNVLETFSISIDFNGIKNHNYLEDLFVMLFINYLPIIIMSLTYYLASFINSKGLSLGSYLSIVNIAFIPFLVIYNLVFRLVGLLSDSIAIIVLFGSVVYTIILSIIGIGDNLRFDNINIKIWYFLICLTVSFAIIFILAIFVFFDGVSPFVL